MPVLCYLVIRRITAATVQMPGYYVERIDTSVQQSQVKYDTVYHRLGSFNLINQLGNPVSLADIEGKVALAHFFCTSCASANPALTENLHRVQLAFAKNDSVLQILSFSTDAPVDSVPLLKAYADRFHADHDTWWFLTGDEKQINDLAQGAFRIQVTGENSGAENMSPAENWILIDKQHYIRGYYNGLDSEDIKRCVNDIALLMLEKEKR